MKKDFILTFLTQFIVLFSGLIVFRLAMQQFGEVGFSEYSIFKRNLAYIYTLAFLGLGVALPRYIALEIGKKSKKENNIFLAALIIIGIVIFFLGFFSYFFKEKIAYLLFGDYKYIIFILPLYVSLVGLILHGVVYSYFRGKMLFKQANIIQIINLGIIPVIVFLFSSNVKELYLYLGFFIILITSVLIVKILLQIKIKFIQNENLKLIPTLLKYGLLRLPADFGLASLLALPAILVSHESNIITAGYVAFSISLLSLSGQAVAPVGLIVLPKISQLVGNNNIKLIQYYTKRLLFVSIFIAIAGTIIYQLFAEKILNLYLDSVNNNLLENSKKIMWAALFYPIYVMMRSIIDAYYEKAYNTITIFIAIIIFMVLYLIYNNIFISLICSMFVLCLVTLYFIFKILRINRFNYE